MATRQKTIQHAFTTLASATNNTLTNLTQTTIYIPESSVTFRSVIARFTADDIITVTGGSLSTKTFGFRLGAAGYTSVANSNALTHGGGNESFYFTIDYTSHFVSNWSGTSMTADFQFQINQSSGTTLGLVNCTCVLDITYDYDDTSTTQIKTVIIPLNAPTGALTSTPTTYDTIPAIGYYLAEPTKTFRNIFVVVEANTANNTSTVDHTLSIAVGAASVTTGNYESALATDRRIRYVWELSGSWPSTTATQNFQLSDTVGRNNHLQAWLVITYEFKADSTSTTLTSGLADGTGTTVSVASAAALGTAPFVITIDSEQMLVTSIASNDLTVTRAYNSTTGVAHSNGSTVSPCATNSVQLSAGGLTGASGGTTSADYQRTTTGLYIEEPGPITGGKIAFNLNWIATANTAGLNARVGTGSFVAYTDNVSVLSGSCGLMIRNDSAFTLARGANSLNADIYRTDTTVANMNPGYSGHWLVTYVSTKSAAGYGAHNHTVRYNLAANGTAGATNNGTVSATAPPIPESDYYISNSGVQTIIQGVANSHTGAITSAEILAAEGGVSWTSLQLYGNVSTDKMGVWIVQGDTSALFKRWPSEALPRIDIETSRRYRWIYNGNCWVNHQLWYTYHCCGPFTVADNVTGSDAGTVTIGLYRSSDGELLKSTTRSGNGAYSFDWWDNTENVFTACTDATGNTARSKDGVASGSP